jgi:hypothetical protein
MLGGTHSAKFRLCRMSGGISTGKLNIFAAVYTPQTPYF